MIFFSGESITFEISNLVSGLNIFVVSDSSTSIYWWTVISVMNESTQHSSINHLKTSFFPHLINIFRCFDVKNRWNLVKIVNHEFPWITHKAKSKIFHLCGQEIFISNYFKPDINKNLFWNCEPNYVVDVYALRLPGGQLNLIHW